MLQVQAVRGAVVNLDGGVVEPGEHEIEVAVAIEVGGGHTPAVAGGDDGIGLVPVAVGTAAEDEGAGVEVDGVLGAVGDDDIGPTVVVEIADEALTWPRVPRAS